jgi:hypothetical protein
MPPVLPQAELSRRRLVDVVRKLDIVKRKIVEGDIRHLLIFAYILAMEVGVLSTFRCAHSLEQSPDPLDRCLAAFRD